MIIDFEATPVHELRQAKATQVDELKKFAAIAAKRSLTETEREQVEQVRDRANILTAAIEQREEVEREGRNNALSRAGKGSAAALMQFREAYREVREVGQKRRVKFDPAALMRAMTPASNSAGKTTFTGTANLKVQPTENISWIDRLAIDSVERNNTVVPYISRADRLTPQNKDYTAQLSGQGYTVSGYTVALSNYYCYLQVHNDVMRDAAQPDLEAMIFDAARGDIMRQIAYDVLLGTGSSNNITGISSTANVQSLSWSSGYLSDYSALVRAARLLMVNAGTADASNLISVMHPMLWEQLALLQAGTDGQPLQVPPQIAGVQLYPYSRIPVNQGTDTDETTLYVFDPSRWTLYSEGYYEISTMTGPDMDRDYANLLVLMRADLATYDPASAVKITAIKADGSNVA
jgi:HK97 family phage major capsid protein